MKQKLFTLLTLALFFCSGAWATTATITLGGRTTKDSKTTAMVPTITSSTATISVGTAASTCATDGYIISTTDGKTIVFSETTYYLCQPYQSGSKKYWKDAGANIYGTFTIPSGYTYTVKSINHAWASQGSNNFKISISIKQGATSYYSNEGISLSKSDDGATITGTNIAIPEASWVTLSEGTYTINITPTCTDSSTGKYFGIAQVVVSGELATACTPVAAPTGLSCTAHTKSSLTFGWTAAENASTYTATLYSDSECTSEVTSTSGISGTSVTFSTLSGSTTYYCKVQSNGDGTTYCAEGGVTDAASGTTDAKDYTVTAATNNIEWGSAASDAGSLDEGETAQITATPESGYKFVSWAVEDGDKGASLSSTTDNPTTLTMGTANATVTATFRALYTYTITYNKGAYGSGDAIADGEKTEDADFTLSSSKYTRDGYLQTGWATSDGGDKAYELGGSYTTNADQTFYPFWTAANTLTYNANGGSGSMAASKGIGSITLTACTFTKDGYSFVGWATSQANADAGIVAYADIASYSLTADATIYAVWVKNFTYLVPATSGDAPSSGDAISMQSGSKGGSMAALSANLSYTVNGLQFGTNSSTKASVTLDYVMKAGSIIVLKLVSAGTGGRGLYLYTNAATPAKKATLGWTSATNGAEATFTYTVQADDGLDGESAFQLWRYNTVQLKSLAVVNCETEAVATASGKTYATYVTTNALDFSAVSDDIKAYVAANTASAGSITFTGKDAVPANTPLLIKTASAGATVYVPVIASADAVGTNYLVAGDGGNVTYDDGEDHYYYILTNGEFKQANNSPVAVGKAYLALPSAATSNELTINFDDEEAGDVTGIATVSSKKQNNGEYYNLNGQRVDASHKGIVIVNGKKFFNK